MFSDWPTSNYASAATSEWSVSPYFPQAQIIAENFGIDPGVFTAVIGAESGFDPNAHNQSGATGLGQLMPATAVAMDVDPTNPTSNLEGSAAYFAQLLQQCNGDYVCASTKYGTLPTNLQNLNPSQSLLLQTEQNANGLQCTVIGGTKICGANANALSGLSEITGSKINSTPYAKDNGECQPLDFVCQIKHSGSNFLTIVIGLIIVTIGIVMLRDNANVPEPIRQLGSATYKVIKSAKDAVAKPVEVLALAS